ncbi:DUF3077 domain-containing protein [Pseudomonas qingdaonensis]|uniref:DUF3077 domain-containing protein n=1 Tax=Pseudomonas qingdaonensis TaxID=2056231 RepID=UPI000C2916B0|nr:DUF3077 domain-containing protein [Pseudomonas qingdaonensis]
MTKIVPDPPLPNTPRKPAYSSFGCCHGDHPPLFSVREDIKLEDALVYLSIMIQCARDTTAQACERADEQFKSLLMASQHSLELSNALIESVLDGMEAKAVSS